MQPGTSRIPTRTKHQAMDWSLVLASQGIETIIDRDPEADTWQLVVPGDDYPRAVQSLRQYVKEYKRPKWCQELPLAGLILDWRSLLPMLFLILLYAADASGRGLERAGIMSNEAVRAGEWWRVFTAVTLHIDLTHLAANVTTGLLLVGVAMGAFGAGIGLLAPFLAGVIGNVAGLMLYGPGHHGLGASGMIFGALGLTTAHSLLLFRHGSAPGWLVIRAILSSILLLILIGLNPKENIDWIAHVAGFAAGFGFGALLSLCPRGWLLSGVKFSQGPPTDPLELETTSDGYGVRPWINRLALALSLLAVGVPWARALRSPAILAVAVVGCLAVWVCPTTAAGGKSIPPNGVPPERRM
jgi:membrane associated rhomboid family serine protease